MEREQSPSSYCHKDAWWVFEVVIMQIICAYCVLCDLMHTWKTAAQEAQHNLLLALCESAIKPLKWSSGKRKIRLKHQTGAQARLWMFTGQFKAFFWCTYMTCKILQSGQLGTWYTRSPLDNHILYDRTQQQRVQTIWTFSIFWQKPDQFSSTQQMLQGSFDHDSSVLIGQLLEAPSPQLFIPYLLFFISATRHLMTMCVYVCVRIRERTEGRSCSGSVRLSLSPL